MISDREGKLRASDRVVQAFGQEWSRFTNETVGSDELAELFAAYTSVFPWGELPAGAVGFDAGCGTGRWARFFVPRVGHLHCVDASGPALEVAKRVLSGCNNVEFHHEELSSLSLPEASCDFGYSLGVLHHIPDTERALGVCVSKLKPGAPFLVYLYHDLEGASSITRVLFFCASTLRFAISRMPYRVRILVTDVLAAVVYLPLALFARLIEKSGRNPDRVPLFQYRNRSFYVMRNDALDRFGTRLEKRYSREEVTRLLQGAGLENIVFSEKPPWWVVVGWRSMPKGSSSCRFEKTGFILADGST